MRACTCVCACVCSYLESTRCVHCVARATQIKTYSWDNAQVIMVGNKCDMDEERVVPPEKGKHLADQLGEFTCEREARSRRPTGIRRAPPGSPWRQP